MVVWITVRGERGQGYTIDSIHRSEVSARVRCAQISKARNFLEYDYTEVLCWEIDGEEIEKHTMRIASLVP